MKRILFYGLLLSAFSFRHPLYLGVLEIKYNTQDKSLQGAVKLFTNDLEDALNKINGKTTDLINPKDTSATEKLLMGYLSKRLAFTVNGQMRSYHFVGFEREEEAVWMYIEIKNCQQPKKLSIENTLLYDFLKEQSNIIHVEIQSLKKSLKLDNPQRQAVFEF